MTAIEVGAEFGPSSWIEMTQEKIQAFADVTDDHNFIHVDPDMAAQTPFGGTIAHGYFTLSLLPIMSYELLPHDDPGAGMALNYGLNKVRFPAPVPSGSRVRGTFRVDAVDEQDWGRQVTMTATIECEGVEKPVCVAETLYRYYRL
jgi:acyl dehydratase